MGPYLSMRTLLRFKKWECDPNWPIMAFCSIWAEASGNGVLFFSPMALNLRGCKPGCKPLAGSRHLKGRDGLRNRQGGKQGQEIETNPASMVWAPGLATSDCLVT